MENAIRRDYQRNPREFDGWLKANAVFGLILAIGMLAMALGGLDFCGTIHRGNRIFERHCAEVSAPAPWGSAARIRSVGERTALFAASRPTTEWRRLCQPT